MSDRSPAARVASALGCTEGQAYTLVIGVIVTVVTVWIGIPPTLRDRVTTVRSIGSEQIDDVPAVPTTPETRNDSGPSRAPLAPVPLGPGRRRMRRTTIRRRSRRPSRRRRPCDPSASRASPRASVRPGHRTE